jgi:hydrogenase assembly chaperone HypC/HupF
MCRIIPRLVLRTEPERAEVDLDGRPTWVDARQVAGVQPGEYVAVYAGIALERLPDELAQELLSFEDDLEQMLAEALGEPLADAQKGRS